MHRLITPLLFTTLVSCQIYDFEPVTPIAIAQTTQARTIVAKKLKPNVMMLVDKSGSMNQAINGAAPNCNNCLQGCPLTCPTRISELKTAMGQFLSQSATVARVGLTFFPSNSECGGSATVAVPLPAPVANDNDSAPLATNSMAVNAQIQGLSEGSDAGVLRIVGGTPTGASLNFLTSYSGLFQDDQRDDFVLLLTDGEPNCNSNNTLSCMANPPPPTNLCTLGPTGCTAGFCRAGYLDKDGTVAAITALRARNVRTIVVGFGTGFAGAQALDVLTAMGIAGGFERRCANDTDCGGTTQAPDRCVGLDGGTGSGLCENRFYAAANATDLGRALARIQDILGSGDPCAFPLEEAPSDDRFLAVIVNGQTTPKGASTWSLTRTAGRGTVQFVGPLCDRVKTSTTADPVAVEFRIVNTL